MDKSLLIRLLGFRAALIHGDTLVLDRWNWLKRKLPVTCNSESLLDVGCGSGAFTIGASLRGYTVTGISWDERNNRIAHDRANICGATHANFVIGDVRKLDSILGLDTAYDVVICLECIEHIIDDRKLVCDLAARIKPGGRLLLTTPNYYYVPITKADRGPFLKEETGWHVRKGYTIQMLSELCTEAKLVCGEISYCSGLLSQKVTRVWRAFNRTRGGAAFPWLFTLPLRLLPILFFDHRLSRLLGYPFYSICLEAYKPRFHPL